MRDICQKAIYQPKEESTMPKIKTHKATAKRFRYSGKKKLRRTRGGGKAGKGYMRHRSKRSKRNKHRMVEVTQPAEVKRVKRLAPYLKKK
jgi:large subunit ribosomal protein L35